MKRKIFSEEHFMFQESVRTFMKREVEPYYEEWEKDGKVSKDLWLKAGKIGMLCPDFPEEYGGIGISDFRYNAIITEELARVGGSGPGFMVHNDINAPYFIQYCNNEQKKRFMPNIASGEWITSIAMTEPNAGSDLQGIKTTAVKDNDHYIINGSKTFISNGIMSDVIILVAKTNAKEALQGLSLFIIESGFNGFFRGKNLDKIGMKGQDTAELYFNNMKVPINNLLGEEGRGFYYLMHNLPRERLSMAISGLASAEAALTLTIDYCKTRMAFGKPIGKFQNAKFKLAEMKTWITIARSFVDDCILDLNEGTLSTEKASMAKYWVTDMQCQLIDECLQLHGGYGYMNEYKIARFFRDARAQRIYGGTNEIMKEIIGHNMGF